jgi:D-tyrosyl-tRNA(Tyr) deacylase
VACEGCRVFFDRYFRPNGAQVIGLLQRVSRAQVDVDGTTIAAIGRGLLVLLAVEPGDTDDAAAKLVDRLLRYRVFEDEAGRMNLSLLDAGGELLLVPQFTLAADTRKGLRPSFTGAAAPELGRRLFEQAVTVAHSQLPGRVAAGQFGADMQVSLTNDGPVTFWLQVPVST